MISKNLNYYYGGLVVNIESFNNINIHNLWKDEILLICNINNLKYTTKLLKEVKILSTYLSKILHGKILYSNKNLSIKAKLIFLNYMDLFYKTIVKVKRVLVYIRLLFLNLKVVGYPVKRRLIKTLKSPHVFNKGQDHFEIRKYKTGIELPLLIFNFDYVSNVIEQCTNLDSMYRLTFKKKEVFLLERYNFK